MFKYILIAIVSLTLGGVLTTAYDAQQQAKQFEAITGINWLSFQAAHADCVEQYKERCKIFGGFAPMSYFRAE